MVDKYLRGCVSCLFVFFIPEIWGFFHFFQSVAFFFKQMCSSIAYIERKLRNAKVLLEIVHRFLNLKFSAAGQFL